MSPTWYGNCFLNSPVLAMNVMVVCILHNFASVIEKAICDSFVRWDYYVSKLVAANASITESSIKLYLHGTQGKIVFRSCFFKQERPHSCIFSGYFHDVDCRKGHFEWRDEMNKMNFDLCKKKCTIETLFLECVCWFESFDPFDMIFFWMVDFYNYEDSNAEEH